MSFVVQCVKETFSRRNVGIFDAYCRAPVVAAPPPDFHSPIDWRRSHWSLRLPSFRHFVHCCLQHLYFLRVAINGMDYAALRTHVEWTFSFLCHFHFALTLMLRSHYSYYYWPAIAMNLLLILFRLPSQCRLTLFYFFLPYFSVSTTSDFASREQSPNLILIQLKSYLGRASQSRRIIF